MDPMVERDQVRVTWWKEKQDEVMDRSRCRVVYTRGLWRFTTKPSGYLVEPQNKDWRLSGRRRDPGALRSFDAGGHATGSRGLHREDTDYNEGVAAQ
jgi:hypothetical protein